ncbi:NADP transhydrogenase subunit alpha [Candidatus Parcubacteria bacterium]|nr:MAG: NADP transhydrogenase subunit alpha [Candidatus Parcubacteria bacterium]
MKKKLAIVGSGISAMTCAFYLKDDFDVYIFDKNDYLGGHTHTHSIHENGKKIKVDTGFIVFNEETYPNMLKMFAELGVEKQKSEMSFSVYNQETGLQFSGTSYSHLFAQKRNFLSIRYIKFLLEINKFFKIAKNDHKKVSGSKETIADYCKRNGLSEYFIENYLAPMSAAVWSTPQEEVYNFPISLLLPFFYNHGLLGMEGQHQWYTVKGGSNTYTKKIVESGKFNIHLNEEVLSAIEGEDKAILNTIKGEYEFDYVVLASHANESLKIAKGMRPEDKELLSSFDYNKNIAILHTDEKVMPPVRKVWSSWNNVIKKDESGKIHSSTIYWMNRLEKLDTKTNYFVSLNPIEEIDAKKTIKKIEYYHPNFTVENFSIQNSLKDLNNDTRIFFAGAYFKYGFHEDGMTSGLNVAEKILNNK